MRIQEMVVGVVTYLDQGPAAVDVHDEAGGDEQWLSKILYRHVGRRVRVLVIVDPAGEVPMGGYP